MVRSNNVKHQKPAKLGWQNVLTCHLGLKLWQVHIFTPKMKPVASHHPAGCVYLSVHTERKPTEDVWMNCNVLKRVRVSRQEVRNLLDYLQSFHLNIQTALVCLLWLKSVLFCHRSDSKSSKCSSRWNGSPHGGMWSAAIAPLVPWAPSLMLLTKDMMLLRTAWKWWGVTFIFLISDKDLAEQQSFPLFSSHPYLIKTPWSHWTNYVFFITPRGRLFLFQIFSGVSGWHHP